MPHENDNSEKINEADILSDEVEIDTGWENPPSLADLKQDLTDAQSSHDSQIVKIDRWRDFLRVEGQAKVNTPQGRSSIVPKLIRKQAEWRYSSLSEPFLSTPDIYNVDPVTAEDKESAKQNQLVLNHQFNNRLNKVTFIDDYVRASVDEGTVIVRLGWENEEAEVDVDKPIYSFIPTQDPRIAQQHQQIHQIMETPQYEQLDDALKAAHQHLMETGQLTVARVKGTETVQEAITLKNQPSVEVCEIRNLIVDPTANGDIDKAKFVIYSYETSKSELEKAGKYKNLDNIILSNNSVLGTPDHATDKDDVFNFKDEPRKRLVAYEYWGYWDIDGTGLTKPFVATWIGNTLIQLEENPFPDGELPFVSVPYLPVRRSTYGEPDGELLIDNQKIMGAVTRGMIDIMGRSANGQTGYRKGSLDVTNKRKFDRGEDYEFNQTIQDPRTAFFMHTFPEIPASAQFMLQSQNAEAESLTGVKAFHNGISGQALGDTATGIRSALDASSKRELGILRRLAEGIRKIGHKIIAMNGEFLDDVEVVRITNEEFVEVRRDDLAGRFDLRLSISTAEADNQKAQELAFMLQTVGNNMDPGMSRMILAEIATLRKMPTLAKRIEEFEPQPDPLAVKKAELEIALLEAQVFNEQAKGQENAVDVDLKKAKTVTEQAKARDLNSSADGKDLDFVETESGTKQARELEKQEHQNRSNLDLEAAKNLLKGEPNNTGVTP